jgi:hypothetical protein
VLQLFYRMAQFSSIYGIPWKVLQYQVWVVIEAHLSEALRLVKACKMKMSTVPCKASSSLMPSVWTGHGLGNPTWVVANLCSLQYTD